MRSWTATTPPCWPRPLCRSATTSTSYPCALRNSPDEPHPQHCSGGCCHAAVGLRRPRRLRRGRPGSAHRSSPSALRRRGVDFTDVIGLPVQMPLANRRFDFTAILESRWRVVARELILALLAPRHPAVAPLPRTARTPLHVRTAKGRLDEVTRWLNWLTQRGVARLAEVDDDCCAAYLMHRRHVRDENGVVIGDRSPATRRGAAQVVVDLLNYGELFTTDRLDPSLRPWAGASASAVAQT